ncbi:MAG: MarC family protein [Candidatus Thermoplasmatota archaeon]|nr:MarC family protein [Candidatus Thermoplasmatota archaeon]
MAILIEFLKVFIPLFVVIDPFSSMVLFMSLTSGMDARAKKTITADAVIYGGIILIFFALVGNFIILFFGISIPALEIAGGLILLIMGIEMVRQGDKPPSSGGRSTATDVGIVPLATPLLAGPGAISLVIILMEGSILTKVMTLISIVVLFLVVYVFFFFSNRINRIFGDKVMKVITRIFGVLVAGFAVQYFINALALLGLK